MSTAYNDAAADSQSYLMAADMNAGMYDGTSSESSASSPLNYNVSARIILESGNETDFQQSMTLHMAATVLFHILRTQCNTLPHPWV